MSDLTANEVLDQLQQRVFHPKSHAMLREVNNATGYRGGRRYADAVICSCWPSRGLWLGGIEVKVSRPDWLSELKSPEKSAEIQKYCSFWWVATPPGIVRDGELPETWGLIEVTRKQSKTVKRAPKLEVAPLDMPFVASVLRNAAAGMDVRVADAVSTARDALRKELELEETPAELHLKIRRLVRDNERLRRDYERLRNRINHLRSAGIDLEGFRADRYAAAIDTIANMSPRVLSGAADSLELLVKKLRQAHTQLQQVEEVGRVNK